MKALELHKVAQKFAREKGDVFAAQDFLDDYFSKNPVDCDALPITDLLRMMYIAHLGRMNEKRLLGFEKYDFERRSVGNFWVNSSWTKSSEDKRREENIHNDLARLRG